MRARDRSTASSRDATQFRISKLGKMALSTSYLCCSTVELCDLCIDDLTGRTSTTLVVLLPFPWLLPLSQRPAS
jgi:hypothetical protein